MASPSLVLFFSQLSVPHDMNLTVDRAHTSCAPASNGASDRTETTTNAIATRWSPELAPSAHAPRRPLRPNDQYRASILRAPPKCDTTPARAERSTSPSSVIRMNKLLRSCNDSKLGMQVSKLGMQVSKLSMQVGERDRQTGEQPVTASSA
jgi:hypothetical protein